MVSTEPILTEWGIWLPAPSLAVAQLNEQLRLSIRPELFRPVLLSRVLAKIKIVEPFCCWQWCGYCDAGYGQVYDERIKRSSQAHRYVYEKLVGPIPEGLTLEHLCRNRACCWPGHLIPMTGEDNTRAMFEARYHIHQPPLDWSLRQRPDVNRGLLIWLDRIYVNRL